MASVTVICRGCNEEKEWPQHLQNRRHQCCAECWARKTRKYRLQNAEAVLVSLAKKRAKQRGLPFNITVEDIRIPKRCPILNKRFHVKQMGDAKRSFPHPYSPSVDRIVPKKGYVKGNIRVVSHRANMLRGDATTSEVKKLYDYLKKEERRVKNRM